MMLDGGSLLISVVIIYLTKNVFYHSVICVFTFATVLLIILVKVPETPHFLFSQRKFDELYKCLSTISKTNLENQHDDKVVE